MTPTRHKKETSYQGINNITYIISAIFIIKMSIVSVVKNGILMKIPLEDVSCLEIIAALKITLILFFMCFTAYFGMKINNFLILLVIIMCKGFIGFICYTELQHMYFCGTWATIGLLLMLKLISFIFYEDQTVKKGCQLTHFLYYLVAPTIIYKPAYRKKNARDRNKIVRLFLKFILTFFLFIFSIDQLTLPIMLKIKRTTNLYKLVEVFLTLSVCVIITFFLFFYLLFCCVLEIFAILTLFDEKDFYGDWWNSKSVKEFWALWNRMVYLWIKKHLYHPLIKLGLSASYSGLVCFFISGLIHEYVIVVSSKIFRGWTFMGFILQFVLMNTTDLLTKKHSFWGNIMFWCLFCVIGQPSCIWLTYR